jgi:hypothetical protein
MTKIMFEMIAFGFKNVIAFIFDFPTGAGRSDNFSDILVINLMASGKSIMIQSFLVAAIWVESREAIMLRPSL